MRAPVLKMLAKFFCRPRVFISLALKKIASTSCYIDNHVFFFDNHYICCYIT